MSSSCSQWNNLLSPRVAVLPLATAVVFSAAVSPCAAIAVACSSAVAVVFFSVAGVVVAIAASASPPPSSPSKVFPPSPVILPPPLPLVCQEMTPKIDAAFDTGSNTKSENLPVQVTSIRLNKDNYLSWSAALEIRITSRGRLSYITGRNLHLLKRIRDGRLGHWKIVKLKYGSLVLCPLIFSL
ncbi:hypothetical protein EJ110_NYTH50992 [Nymphaea thermarum]|nr:hypothetical protein EJ110_NYTH50992 [Nymphaea thermarum]